MVMLQVYWNLKYIFFIIIRKIIKEVYIAYNHI